MKIACVAPPFITVPPAAGGHLHYGGLEQVCADICEVLAKMGHDVTVFAADKSKVPNCRIYEFGPAIENVHVNWNEAEFKSYVRFKDALSGFDIINAHTWYGYEFAVKTENPELRIVHTHHGGHGRSLLQWAYMNLNIIATSYWMQSVFKKTGFNSRVIHCGINLDRYPFKREKGDRLVFIGRIDPFKGAHIAIEVAKRLGMGLDVVGGIWVREREYLEQVKRSCDGKQIKLFLNAPHEVKLELLQNARALLFCSGMGEPFGLTPVEAMACGTVPVCRRDGAVAETVADGETGFVCDSLDEMVEKVKMVDNVKPIACRQRVEKLFSREIMTRNYLEIYKLVTEGAEW